jgi:hypothetical protein
LLVRDSKVTRQPKKIAFRHFYSIITATIGRALRAIVQHPQRTMVLIEPPITSHSHSDSLARKA